MPVETLEPLPSPSATIKPYNTSMAMAGAGGGLTSIVYSNMLPIGGAIMSLIVIVGSVAYYMGGDRRGGGPEAPQVLSRDDIYSMVLGEPHRRTRRQK